jgi:5-formyltetrahydrofolate cyclo-ligase
MLGSDPRKQALRPRLLELRRGLDPADLAARSAALSDRLRQHPLWIEARGVAAFVGVRNEPDTQALLEAILNAGKRLWLPRLTGPGLMRFWPCAELASLEPGRMGLREPAIVGAGATAPGPAEGVDLMLVPGLGFGTDGARIGFGKGHYDRALASRPRGELPRLIGVCLAEFLDPFGEPVPVSEHDVGMDGVVTELGLVLAGDRSA